MLGSLGVIAMILKISNVLMNPSQLNHIDNVQSYFLRYLSYNFGMECPKKDLAMKLGPQTFF